MDYGRGKKSSQKVIGENFKRRRERLNLTKTHVAGQLGYTRHWVQRLEEGKTCFDFSMSPQVKDLLGLKSIEDLLL